MTDNLYWQEVQLVSENGHDSPILLQIMHKNSELPICIHLAYFEAFHDAIALSWYFKDLFSHLN